MKSKTVQSEAMIKIPVKIELLTAREGGFDWIISNPDSCISWLSPRAYPDVNTAKDVAMERINGFNQQFPRRFKMLVQND